MFIVDSERGRSYRPARNIAFHWAAYLRFTTATDYLSFVRPELPGCLVLSFELANAGGVELQRQLSNDRHPPIVFVAACAEVSASVRAIRAGAIDFC